MSLRKSSSRRNGSTSDVGAKPNARRRCTPAPSRVGLALTSRLTGRMDIWLWTASEGPALGPALGLVLRSSGGRAGSSPRLLVAFIPLGYEGLVRSRMIHIADAPAGRVIGLRRVAQLMAQRNLVGGTRTAEAAALLNCPIYSRPEDSSLCRPSLLTFCYTA